MTVDRAADEPTLPPAPTPKRADDHFSSLVGMFLVGYLARSGGQQLVDSVLALAGESRRPDQLCDPTEWSSYDQARRLIEATSEVAGPEAVFEATATSPRSMDGSAYLEMFHAIGSPTNLIAKAGELTTTLSTITSVEAVEIAPCHWEMRHRFAPGFEPFTGWCHLYAGLCSTYPVFYGFAPAEVVEEECQTTGARACRFRVTWSETGSEPASADHFQYLSELLSVRLRELQRTVADLVSSDDLEVILSEIVASARRTVNAPSYVLALEAMPGALRKVYAESLDETEAGQLAARLMAGEPDPGTLAVEVRSARRSYGWLAAVEPTGNRRFLAEERSVLDTYASVAAAALDVAIALDQARQQTVAAEAMSALLADERVLLSSIVEGLPHGVCWSDRGSRLDGANQALVELLGYGSIEDVRRRTWSTLCPDPEATAELEAWTSQVTGGGAPVINAELTLRPEPDSDPLIVLVSVVALASGNDEPRVLSIWADITGQRALEQRLAAASRLESIGQLAAGIAHEINTPMQYIGDNGAFLGKAYESVFGLVDGLVELAAGGGIEASRVEQLMKEAKVDLLRRRIPVAAEQVTDGVGTVSQIVRSLKTFAHPGGDEVEPVDIVEVVESTVTVSRAVWRGVADVDLDLDGQPLLIRAVPGMINQVVLNLVVNAAHAIEDRRSSGDQRPGSIVIATSAAERMVELSVGDNGGGIPGEVRDRVYDQFVTTKAVGRGTGQGLAICHNIITGNGGTIDFTTGPAGTTFTVCLPRWED